MTNYNSKVSECKCSVSCCQQIPSCKRSYLKKQKNILRRCPPPQSLNGLSYFKEERYIKMIYFGLRALKPFRAAIHFSSSKTHIQLFVRDSLTVTCNEETFLHDFLVITRTYNIWWINACTYSVIEILASEGLMFLSDGQ